MESIVVAFITGGLALVGVVISNNAAADKTQTQISTAQAVTDTKLEELTRELDRIHSLGFSEIDEELQMGICGVACPIFDLNGEAAASLAFTTVKTGDEAALKDKIRQLKSAAEEITRAIK